MPGDYNCDADDFIFWDEIHPTDRVHEMLGNQAARLEASDYIVTAAALERQPTGDDTAAGPSSDDDDDDTCFISITGARLLGLFFCPCSRWAINKTEAEVDVWARRKLHGCWFWFLCRRGFPSLPPGARA
ncbi:MAG: hypothetical protein ACQERN_13745 [Thermodesulfobacteriota bacterium]